MQTLAEELEVFIDKHVLLLRSVQDSVLSEKPGPEKWSKQEIMGHLCDSAESNIRRFVIGQYEETPLITYNQDKWVAIIGYQQWDPKLQIDLWWALNKQICRILSGMKSGNEKRMVQTEALHSIEWLAHDYFKHLKHHIHQVLELAPIPYP